MIDQETDQKKCALLTIDMNLVLSKHEPTIADMMSTFAALIAKSITRDVKPEYWEAMVAFNILLMKRQYDAERSRLNSSIH